MAEELEYREVDNGDRGEDMDDSGESHTRIIGEHVAEDRSSVKKGVIKKLGC